MRLIDADALIEKCGDWYVEEGTESGFIGTLKNLLATEPTIQPQSTAGQLNDGARSTAQSTDLIDRQEAINALDKRFDDVPMELTTEILQLRRDLRELPSAQPERRGRWIKLDMHAHLADHKCTACGQECYVPTCMGEPMYTYCPNCGADMRGEKDG